MLYLTQPLNKTTTKNNEIVFSPLFSWNVDDNCKWLDQKGEYYNQFLIQCNELDALCKDSSITYYDLINY